MLLQASHLPLPAPNPSAFPISLLADPVSSSLALTLPDSTLLLFPPLSPSSLPPSPTPIPFSTTSAAFLRLQPQSRTLFLSLSPHLPSNSSLLLRSWSLLPSPDRFVPSLLSFKRDTSRPSLALGLPHGFGASIAASVNVVVVHSPAANQIWIMAARMEGAGGGGLRLMKSAVVECEVPIYGIRASMGSLVVGEVEGVRVFPLRPLIKRRGVKHKGGGVGRGRMGGGEVAKKKCGINGVVVAVGRVRSGAVKEMGGVGDGRGDVVADSGKLRTLKLRQTSGDYCSFFVPLRCAEVQNSESSGTRALTMVKAVAIHVMSEKKFLVLDSIGDLHLLTLQNTVFASEANVHSSITSECAHVYRLDLSMKVQMLAVLPITASRTQVAWLSDGAHSVHVVPFADTDSSVKENDKDESKEKSMQVSVSQAIFTSEKVQDIVSLSSDAVLILGQGNIFAYAIA